MNITALYKQLTEGKISKDFFMKTARMQFPQYISPVTSFNDTVNILKGKRLISEEKINEAHKLTTAQIIDRLNPYHFRKGLELELSKIKDPNDQDYERVREKVAKKMQKNPLAYEDQVFANAKEVEKKDKPLHTHKAKEGETVDKNLQMKKAKGQGEAKANTKASKKENRKGNPKGVKHMTYNAKKAKGISKVLPATGKEKILESYTKKDVLDFLKNFLLEETNPYHDYQVGKEVKLPEGTGIIKEVHGSTLTVEMQDGSLKDVQINYAKHYTENETQEPPHTQSEYAEEGVQEQDEEDLDVSSEDEYNEYSGKTPEYIFSQIRSHIETSSVFDEGGFKEQALNMLDDAEQALNPLDGEEEDEEDLESEEDKIEEAIQSLEDLAQYIQDSYPEEYKQTYKNAFESLIPTLDASIQEAFDVNDPVLVAVRADKDKKQKNQGQKNQSKRKIDPHVLRQIKDLKAEYDQVMRDMEQEAEPEGGVKAGEYADRLMNLAAQIKNLYTKNKTQGDEMEEVFLQNPENKTIVSTPNNKINIAKSLGFTDKITGSDEMDLVKSKRK